MEAFISITISIIAVLAVRNYQLFKAAKKYDPAQLIIKNEELKKANYKLAIEVQRQQKINLTIVEKHNELREAIMYMPPESGRYFSITLKNGQALKNFSEN